MTQPAVSDSPAVIDSKGWTPERTEQLSTLWKQGYSASEISLRLGNVTRNAVLGKVNRLGLPKRLTRMTLRGRAPRKVSPARHGSVGYGRGVTQRAPREPQIFVQPISAQRMKNGNYAHTMDLTHAMCRWPFGNPEDKDFHYCGRVSETGKTYCDTHQKLAYDSQRSAPTYSDKYLEKLAAL